MTDQTRTVPERESQLLDRIAKILQVLSDAQTALSDGECDMAEAWLDKLPAAESVVASYPCVMWPEEEEEEEGDADGC